MNTLEPAEILAHLTTHDIEVRVEDDRLLVRAPKGVLTADLRQLIAAHKPALIALLARPAARPTELLPLSEGQKAMWFLSQLVPDGVAYNVSLALHLQGALSRSILQASIRQLGELHPLLLARFIVENGSPLMLIDRSRPLAAEIVDVPDWSLEQIHARVQALSELPFRLGTVGASRLLLFRRSASDSVLLISIHHIVVDYWSLPILVNDLSTIYQRHRAATPRTDPERRLSYAEFVGWQKRFLRSPEGARQREYWHTLVAGELPALDLPTDQPRPATPKEHGDEVRLRLDRDQTQAIRTFAASEKSTLFAVLVSGLVVLLYRYTGQSEILIGTPYHGRGKKEFERAVGYFINFLVLRAKVSPEMSFRTLLQQMYAQILNALSNADYPFSLLVESLCPRRDVSRNPIYQITIDWMTATDPLVKLISSAETQNSSQFGDLRVRPLPLRQLDAVSDQIWMISDLGDSFAMKLGYSSDLFSVSSATAMLAHYVHLLQQGCADAEQSISDLSLMSAEDRARVLAWGGEERTPLAAQRQALVLDRFEAQVRRAPDALAMDDGTGRTTYRELDGRSTGLAQLLQARGVGPDRMVGLHVEKLCDLIVGVLAVLKAGGACVILDAAADDSYLRAVLGELADPIVVTSEALSGRLASVPERTVCLNAPAADASVVPANWTGGPVEASHLACVIYGDGEYGNAPLLGTLVEHRVLWEGVQRATSVWNLGEGSRVLLQWGHECSHTLIEILATLCSGGALMTGTSSPLYGEALFRQLDERSITSCMATAAALASLPDKELPALHSVVVCGRPSTAARLKKLGPHVEAIFAYGHPETMPFAAAVPLNRDEKAALIGRPAEGAKLLILDDQQNLLPTGVVGELYIGGCGLARGYLNNAPAFPPRWLADPFSRRPGERLFRTGTLARYRWDGTVEYVGPAGEQVRVQGARINLARIEDRILSQPDVKDCVVVNRADRSSPARLVAYVQAEGERPSGAAHLMSSLCTVLPPPELPHEIVFVDALPLSRNGQVNEADLPPYSDEALRGRHRGYAPPRDPFEQSLVQIWESILQTAPIGIHDDFFDLGGHSLLAVRVLTQVQTQLHRAFPLSTFLQTRTVARLADFLRGRPQIEKQSTLVPLREGTGHPLFLVHPIGGNVLCYAALAQHLGDEATIHGLQSPALEEDGTRCQTLEELAAHYVETIRACQPEGPYAIAGWSFGGVVAFEVAQQLVQQGSKVDLLAIIDCVPPAMLGAFSAMDDVGVVSWLKQRTSGAASPQSVSPQATGIDGLMDDMSKRGLLPDPADEKQIEQMLRVYRYHGGLLRNYTPRPYPAGLTLFLARERWHMPPIEESTAAWQALCADDVRTQILPGDHFSLLLSDASLGLLAEALKPTGFAFALGERPSRA